MQLRLKMAIYETVVIGAGIAGCTALLKAAKYLAYRKE